MKIAYVLHGHSRTWRECHQSFFDNIFSVAPGDIFIHTWDRINSKSGSHWNGWAHRLHGHLEEISSKTTDIDGIIKTYNPKYMMVETDRGADYWDDQLFSKYDTHILHPHVALKNYFYGKKKIFDIAKSFGNYDKYFFSRLDLKFHNKIDTSIFDLQEIVIPTADAASVFDIWKIGNTEQMTLCTNFFDEMDEWFYGHPLVKNNIHTYVIENAVFDYWRSKQLQYVLPHQEIDPRFEIVRITENTY